MATSLGRADERGACYFRLMSDPENDPPEALAETPIQRALRLKKAALDAKPKPPRGGKFQREQAAGVQAGKSRPWMKK